MEPGGGAGSSGDGRRKSSRIPILSSKLRNTDAEDKLSQQFESEVVEEELRTGAEVVVAHLQEVEEEAIEDEVPELLVGGEDDGDVEGGRGRGRVHQNVAGDGRETVPEQQTVAPIRVHRQQGGVWAPGPANAVQVGVEDGMQVEEHGGGGDRVEGEQVADAEGGQDGVEGRDDDPAVQNIDILLELLGGEGGGGGGDGVPLPVGGERGEVRERESPVIPGPQNVEARADDNGWSMVDKLGGWKALISAFGSMDEVPAQHKAVWAWAWGEIMRRILEAEEGSAELDRALMWLLFLPQALCRKPEGRGGARGRGFINQRFGALAEGRWGELVRLWEIDHAKAQERLQRRGQGVGEERGGMSEEKRKKDVLKLLGKGQIHRAVDRINSFGVADLADPEVLQQVLDKHPPRWQELPASVEIGSPVENLRGLRSALQSLKRGGAPGTGGLRAEYLISLAEDLDDDKMELVEEFGLRYLRGQLPAWFYSVFLSSKAVALFKTVEQVAVRPIGVRHSLLRVLHRMVVKQNKAELLNYLEPEQQAMSEAGCHKVVFTVRTLLEENPHFICVKLDVKNAQNCISRAKCVQQLEAIPELRHLAWHAATVLAPHTGAIL